MSRLINGINYGWSDVTAKIPGMELELQSIDYGDELEKEATYGIGAAPKGFGRGNYKATCKFGMLLDDYEQFERYCKDKGKKLYELVIPKIIVSYANDGERTRTDVINKVTITKVDNKAAQGDKTLPVDIETLVVGKIVRDGLEPI